MCIKVKLVPASFIVDDVTACSFSSAAGRGVFIVAIREFADAALYAGLPHQVVRLGAGGALVAAFKAAGVRDLVILGRAKRPSLLAMMPDAWMAAALAPDNKAFLETLAQKAEAPFFQPEKIDKKTIFFVVVFKNP